MFWFSMLCCNPAIFHSMWILQRLKAIHTLSKCQPPNLSIGRGRFWAWVLLNIPNLSVHSHSTACMLFMGFASMLSWMRMLSRLISSKDFSSKITARGIAGAWGSCCADPMDKVSPCVGMPKSGAFSGNLPSARRSVKIFFISAAHLEGRNKSPKAKFWSFPCPTIWDLEGLESRLAISEFCHSQTASSTAASTVANLELPILQVVARARRATLGEPKLLAARAERTTPIGRDEGRDVWHWPSGREVDQVDHGCTTRIIRIDYKAIRKWLQGHVGENVGMKVTWTTSIKVTCFSRPKHWFDGTEKRDISPKWFREPSQPFEPFGPTFASHFAIFADSKIPKAHLTNHDELDQSRYTYVKTHQGPVHTFDPRLFESANVQIFPARFQQVHCLHAKKNRMAKTGEKKRFWKPMELGKKNKTNKGTKYAAPIIPLFTTPPKFSSEFSPPKMMVGCQRSFPPKGKPQSFHKAKKFPQAQKPLELDIFHQFFALQSQQIHPKYNQPTREKPRPQHWQYSWSVASSWVFFSALTNGCCLNRNHRSVGARRNQRLTR